MKGRSTFVFDASDESGPLFLKVRRLTLQQAIEMRELVARVRQAHLKAKPADDAAADVDADADPLDAPDAEEQVARGFQVQAEADRYTCALVRFHSESGEAGTWQPCRITSDEVEEDEDAGVFWVEGLPAMVRQEIMLKALSEFGEAQRRVARFHPRARRLLRKMSLETGMPPHELVKLSWSDFLLDAVCVLQGEEDLVWELTAGTGKNRKPQGTLALDVLSSMTREV